MNFEKLIIETSYCSSVHYITLNCHMLVSDEQTGNELTGGSLQVIVMSEGWTNEHISLPKLADGIDERLSKSIMCLQFNRLYMGTIAAIIQSEFSGFFRAFENQAFNELTSYLFEVLHVDNIVTFLPFQWEAKKKLGYKKIHDQDNRPYSVKSRDQEVLSWIESDDEGDDQLYNAPIRYNGVDAIQYNLRSVESSRNVSDTLSEDAIQIINVFEQNNNKPMVSAEIRGLVSLTYEDMSLAILELIELDLVEETTSHEVPDVENEVFESIIESNNLCNDSDIVRAVMEGDIDKVKEIIKNEGFDVNTVGRDGKVLLFVAIEKANVDMVSYLLECGADPNYETSEGLTPLKLCWLNQNRKIEKLLCSHGATITY